MTRYMLDTITVSHLLKKHPPWVARQVIEIPISDLCISAVNRGEVLFGLARRPDATALHGVVRKFLRRVDVLPWDTSAVEVYEPARAATQGEGRVLVPVDLLIGSHALSLGAILVTNDRAFRQQPGLPTEDRTEEVR